MSLSTDRNSFQLKFQELKQSQSSIYFLFFAALVFLFLIFTDSNFTPIFLDLNVVDIAGIKALNHHTVYDVKDHYQFKYSPFVALSLGAVLKTLGSFSMFYKFSILLWIILLASITFDFSKRFANQRSFFTCFLQGTALFSFVFGLHLREELRYGQVNFLPLLFSWLAFKVGDFKPRRTSRLTTITLALVQGILFSYAIQVKLYAVFLAPLFALKKRWDVLLISALSFLAFNLGAVGLYSGYDFAFQESVAWFQTLFRSSNSLKFDFLNMSILGAVGKWKLSPLEVLAWLAGALYFFSILWKLRRKDWRIGLSWTWAGILLLNPLVWFYWLLILYPLVLFVWLQTKENSNYSRTTQFASILFYVAMVTSGSWIGHHGLSLIGVFISMHAFTHRIQFLPDSD